MAEADDISHPAGKLTDRKLPAPAQRALAEAEARRRAYLENEAALPKEIGGRKGKEPVRYGDWEIKGLASAPVSSAPPGNHSVTSGGPGLCAPGTFGRRPRLTL